MAERKIREFLTGNGIQDDQITYNNGRVMVKGRDFMGATPRADGSTYGDEKQLTQAFNAYNNQGYAAERDSLMNQAKQKINTQPTPFTWNRQTDPLYQDAIKSAQMNAQTAGNNASVRLGARGIGNSQQALTTENQIQQRELGQVERDIAPQLYNQAYNKYKDEYSMGQDAIKNLLGLSNTNNNMYNQGKTEEQQVWNNDRLIKADNLSAARNVGNDLGRVLAPKSDWSNLYNQDDAPLNFDGRKYEADIAQRAIDNTYKANAQAIQQQNANTSANRPVSGGSKPATPKPEKPVTYKEMPEFESSKAYIYKDPVGALTEIQDNMDQLITDYGTDGYDALLTLAMKLVKASEE